MNKIYLPYLVELILKIVSWIIVILIDTIELIFTPFKRIGLKCSVVFVALSAVFCVYASLSFGLTIGKALSFFVVLLILFVIFLGVVNLINYLLVNICRPQFANIIFAPVCVYFRKPNFLRRGYRYKTEEKPEN